MPRVLPDDNGGVSENTFFHHLKTIDDLERQKQAIQGKLSAQWKKAEEDGVDKAAMKVVMKDRAVPMADLIKRHNNETLYKRFLKVPGSETIPMIDEKRAEGIGLTDEERSKRWEDEGYIAGKSGKNRDICPHEDPNSLGARVWMKGYEAGQAELAKGIKKKPADPPKEEPKAGPKDEPEVAAAKAKGKGKQKGVTYWHNAELKKVYEVATPDEGPVGTVSITRPEYEKLKAEYDEAEKAAWDAAAEAEKAKDKPAADLSDFGDENPPAPGTKLN